MPDKDPEGPMRKRRLQIVEIRWADITGHGPEWKSADEVAEMSHAVCRTVGYLWWRGKVRGIPVIKVVGTITDDYGVGDINVIPVGVVSEMKVLAIVSVEVDGDSDGTGMSRKIATR